MHRTAKPGSSKASRGLRTILVAVLLAAGVSAQTAGAIELRNGVVIDPQAGKVYLMSPEGGIDAVSLASGNVEWHSDAAARPIAVSAAGLLAQVEDASSGGLQLAVLDSRGSAVRTSTVALPEGIGAPVADQLNQRFLVRAASGPGQPLVVGWQSTDLPPRGALIAEDPAAPRLRSGTFAFDTATGLAGATTLAQGPLASRPIEVTAGGSGGSAASRFLSADGSYRLESVPGTGSAAATYRWTILDAGGRSLGTVTNRAAYAPFHVSGGMLFYVSQPGAFRQGDEMVFEPLSLRAVSLAGGAEQWSRPIRDTEYRGPFPP